MELGLGPRHSDLVAGTPSGDLPIVLNTIPWIFSSLNLSVPCGGEGFIFFYNDLNSYNAETRKMDILLPNYCVKFLQRTTVSGTQFCLEFCKHVSQWRKGKICVWSWHRFQWTFPLRFSACLRCMQNNKKSSLSSQYRDIFLLIPFHVFKLVLELPFSQFLWKKKNEINKHVLGFKIIILFIGLLAKII